jgi:hypothetical protein
MIQDWINVLDKEFIFWHRVHNLETALKNAKNKLFKSLWKKKLTELMKKPENRDYQLKVLNEYGKNVIPMNRTLH